MLIPRPHHGAPLQRPFPFTMGSAFEAIQFLFSEYLVTRLAERLGQSEDAMRARHTNLE